MSGLGIKLYTDEDVDADLAIQLEKQGYDVLSCTAAGNAHQALDDEWQLRFAVAAGRAILVHNIADYVALDDVWKRRGAEHCGIIFVEQSVPIGELVRRTKLHLDTCSPEYQFNLGLYLPS